MPAPYAPSVTLAAEEQTQLESLTARMPLLKHWRAVVG